MIAAGQPMPAPLEPAGLAIMIVSIASIATLVVWCYWRLLRRRDPGPE